MNASPHTLFERPRAQRLAAWLALLSVCAIFTVGAVRAFPIWDDGWLWLLLEEQGTDAILASHPERPVTVGLWSLLGPSADALWRNAFVAQALGWPLLALLAASLWRRLYPALERYAVVVGLVTVAPFVTKVQMVTANVTLTSLPSVLLGYVGVLLAFRFVAGRGPKAAVWLALGLIALAAGVLLQEYAVPVAAAGVILLTCRWLAGRHTEAGRRCLQAATALAMTAAAAYWLYLSLADFGAAAARGVLNPQQFLVWDRAAGQLWRDLPRSVGEGLVGGLVRSAVSVFDAGSGVPLALAVGALIATLLAWGTRVAAFGEGTTAGASSRWDWVALAAALAVALVPPILAGQPPWDPNDGLTSRFGLPALPILAALIVRLGVVPWRARVRWIPIAVLAGLAGATAVTEASAAISERLRLATMSDCLRPIVESSEGIAVVAVPSSRRALGPPRQWELVARLAAEGGEGLSERLWAHRLGGGPPLPYREEASRLFGPRERCRSRPRLKRQVRNLRRVGKMGPLLWVDVSEDDTVLVESYCRPGGAAPEFRATCP